MKKSLSISARGISIVVGVVVSTASLFILSLYFRDLHEVFSTPLTDQCMLPCQDIDYPVPAEYQIRSRIAGRICADPPLENISDETLFWIFYNCCREEVQLIAAKELYVTLNHYVYAMFELGFIVRPFDSRYVREWRFHKKKLKWITRVPGSDAIREGGSEQGTYLCWDPLAADKVIQQMTINYADLDDSPTTYQLSANTLNARVHLNTPSYHPQSQQQQQHHQQQIFSSSSGVGSSGPNYFAQTGRIPRQTVTNMATKLPVMSSMLPSNGSAIGVMPQQMPVAKPDVKGSDSTLPLVGAAPSSAAAVSSSADVINATPVTSSTPS